MTIIGTFIITSICCIQPLYKVIIQKKEPFNFCHCGLMFFLLIPIFGVYISCYSMEVYFQKTEYPPIFSQESFTYLIAGFLKPLPIFILLGIMLIVENMKRKNESVHSIDTVFKDTVQV